MAYMEVLDASARFQGLGVRIPSPPPFERKYMTYLLIAVAYFITGLAVIGLFLWWSDRRRMMHLLGFALMWPFILGALVAMVLYDLISGSGNDDWDQRDAW